MPSDSELDAPAPSPQTQVVTERNRPTPAERAVALLEVLLCSDYLTQWSLAQTFAVFGYLPFAANGRLLVGYVMWLSVLDTALLVGLILLFLSAHGERPLDVLIGRRPVAREVVLGFPLTFAALAIGIAILATIQIVAPTLHTVEHNPLQDLIRTPRDAMLFAIVAVVAGGVREELQRAFLLHRFEVGLGGGAVGVAVTSIAFGGGHLIQGVDAGIATGVLGAFWGLVYLRRRSAVAPIVSHSGFNLLQIVQFMIFGR